METDLTASPLALTLDLGGRGGNEIKSTTKSKNTPGHRVREYGSAVGDWQMVSAWWAAHAPQRVLTETTLPPLGLVVERAAQPPLLAQPVAALWCHLSAGIGVAFLESPVSRPGLSLAEASAAFTAGLAAIEAICRAHDYGVLVAHTLPGIATWLERRGGFVRDGERVQLQKRIG